MPNILHNTARPAFLQKYSRKQLVYTAVGLIILTVLSLHILNRKPDRVIPVPLVRTQIITGLDSGSLSTYSGEVRGRYERQLSFQASGKILRRNVDLGSKVEAGQVLLEIDPKDIAQSNNTAAAAVSSTEAQLSLAEKNLSRYQTLYEQQAISRLQLDNIQLQYQAALASYRQASAQYTQSDNLLEYTKLVADKPGVVAAINVEAGQVVAAGQPIVTVVQDGEREIEISVPENKLSEIKQAKGLKITFWALKDIVVKGVLREISPMSDAVTRTYKARITLQNPPPDLNLGMTAAVSVAAAPTEIVLLPLSAIYQTTDTPQVWVVADNKVQLRPVTVGKFHGDKIEILSGINIGDTVVTAGVHKLREGQNVRLNAGEQP